MIWPYAVAPGGGRRALVLHVPALARHCCAPLRGMGIDWNPLLNATTP
jgi:hypothetical protein